MKRLGFIRGAGFLALLNSGRIGGEYGDRYFPFTGGLVVVTHHVYHRAGGE